MIIKPKQRVSNTERDRNDKEWYNNTANYFRDACKPIINKEKAMFLMRIAEGYMDESEYLYVTNPLNTDRVELQGYPAKMRNIPIIPPNVKLLQAEKSRRALNFVVNAINSSLENDQKEYVHKQITESLQQVAINQMAAQGMSDEEMAQVPKTPQQIAKEAGNMVDELAIMGQQSLNYIRYYNELDEKFKDEFYYAVVMAAVVTYRDIIRDETEFQVVPPFEMSVLSGVNKKYLQDMEAHKRSFKMTVNEIFDKFEDSENFTKEVQDYLLNKIGGDGGAQSLTPSRFNGYSDVAPANFVDFSGAHRTFWNNLFGSSGYIDNDELIEVDHVIWTTMIKKGMVYGVDPLSGEYSFEVDEDYKPLENEYIDWTWVQGKAQCWIIDNKYYVGRELLPITFADIETPNKPRSLYNGIIMGGGHVTPISEVELGVPYQIKHNIINYHIDKTIAKNRDKIVVMPMSLIPNKEGHDEDSTVYYMDAHGILWINDKGRDAVNSLQAIKILDASLNDVISQMLAYAQANRAEYDEMLGITRQRKGQVFASDGKGTNEEAIYRSSMMSEQLFATVDGLHQKDLQTLIEFAQIAFSNGKVASYTNSNYKTQYMNINPEMYCNAKYGVTVINTQTEQEKLNIIKNMALAYAQDPNVKKSMSAEVVRGDSVSEIIEKMRELEATLDEQKAADQQFEKQMNDDQIAAEDNRFNQELQFKYYEADQKNLTLRMNKLADINAKLMDIDLQIKGGVDKGTLDELFNKREELVLEQTKVMADIQLKTKELNQKAEDTRSRERTEKYKADQQVKVARANKNKYDKKK